MAMAPTATKSCRKELLQFQHQALSLNWYTRKQTQTHSALTSCTYTAVKIKCLVVWSLLCIDSYLCFQRRPVIIKYRKSESAGLGNPNMRRKDAGNWLIGEQKHPEGTAQKIRRSTENSSLNKFNTCVLIAGKQVQKRQSNRSSPLDRVFCPVCTTTVSIAFAVALQIGQKITRKALPLHRYTVVVPTSGLLASCNFGRKTIVLCR